MENAPLWALSYEKLCQRYSLSVTSDRPWRSISFLAYMNRELIAEITGKELEGDRSPPCMLRLRQNRLTSPLPGMAVCSGV
jgi:hypothetical protein